MATGDQGGEAGGATSDVLAGALFAAIAAGALVVSSRYPVGTVVRMGPGFVPRLVAWGLLALGLAMVARGAWRREWRPPSFAPRPIVFIALSVVVFALAIDRLGLFVASVLGVVLAAAAEPGARWRQVPVIALALASFCALLFGYALNLPVAVWPP